MPRTVIPLQEAGPNGGGIDSVTMTAGDSGNGMYFDNTSGMVDLLVLNTNAAPKAVVVKGVTDENGRTGDKTLTCPATTGKSSGGPYPIKLFNQLGAADLGKTFVDIADATNVTIAAIKRAR